MRAYDHDNHLMDSICQFWEDADQFTNGWLTNTQEILSNIADSNRSISVVISRNHLIYAVSSIIIFNLKSYFPIDSIHSMGSPFHTLTDVLYHLKRRFQNAKSIMISSESCVEEICKEMGMGIVKPRGIQDLKKLIIETKKLQRPKVK